MKPISFVRESSASNYGPDGTFAPDLPPVDTVGALLALLSQLPSDLPIEGEWSHGLQPKWNNVGADDEHLAFSDTDEE